MATDFTKLPKEILVDLINETNGTAFGIVDLDLGDVLPLPIEPLPGQDPPPVTLACILARPGKDSVLSGEALLMYRRIHVAVAFAATPPFVALRGASTRIAHLLPQINRRFGFNLRTEDIWDADLEPTYDANELVPFTLAIVSDSLVYVGSIRLHVLGVSGPPPVTPTVNALDAQILSESIPV